MHHSLSVVIIGHGISARNEACARACALVCLCISERVRARSCVCACVRARKCGCGSRSTQTVREHVGEDVLERAEVVLVSLRKKAQRMIISRGRNSSGI